MTVSANKPTQPSAPPSARVALSTRLRARYAACTPRERRLLVIALAVVLSGGLIALADYLASERERLARSLPAAHLAYLGMEQDSLGLAALKERPVPTALPLAALPESIKASASVRGIVVEPRLNGDVIEASGTTTLVALVNWLAALQAEQGLRPIRLEVQPATADGRARFEAVFEVGVQ